MTGVRDLVTGWPFLVARGRQTDYRTISAPEFLVDVGAYGVLSDSVTRADMRDGEVRVVRIDSPVGPLTAVYTSERLSHGSNGAEDWPCDEHGRPLQILYGIVTRGAAEVDAPDLTDARAQALVSLRRFLANERGYVIDRTSGRELPGLPSRIAPAPRALPASSAATSPPPTPVPAPAHREASPRAALWAGGGLAALVAVAALWTVFAPGDEPRDQQQPQPSPRATVRVALQPSPAAGSCTDPVVLTAAITTDRAATVKYHWESPPGKAVARVRALKFSAAATQRVSANVARSKLATKGDIAYALVVDAPAKQQAHARYPGKCPPAADPPAPEPPAAEPPAADPPAADLASGRIATRKVSPPGPR